MKPLAMVVIPIYKRVLDPYEKISLAQLDKVLYKYPKVFVAPQSLVFDYGDEYADWQVERFPDRYFKNTETYSKLCLSPEFYERFLSYRYMLIYQTDAFVFSDRLEEFCSMDYDYIGAPVPQSIWRFLGAKVGNGGFSLRKIDSVLRVLRQKESILYQALQAYSAEFVHERLSVEDQFFAYCGTLPALAFSVPSVRTASNFSVECNVGHSYDCLPIRLPFGCHRWYNNSFRIWGPLLQQYGYQISKQAQWFDGVDELRKEHIGGYLFERFLRRHGRQVSYSVWGYGDIGHQCVDFLQRGGYPVSMIYDTQAAQFHNAEGIPVKEPQDAELMRKRTHVVIATNKYGAEIEAHLQKLGLNQGIDFARFFSVRSYSFWGCKR